MQNKSWFHDVLFFAGLVGLALLLQFVAGLHAPWWAWSGLVVLFYAFCAVWVKFNHTREQIPHLKQRHRSQVKSLQGLITWHEECHKSLEHDLGREQLARARTAVELERMLPLALWTSAGLRPLPPLFEEEPDGPKFEDRAMTLGFEWLYKKAVLLTLIKNGEEVETLHPDQVEIQEVEWGEVTQASYSVYFSGGKWRRRKDGLHDRRDVVRVRYRFLKTGVAGSVYLEDGTNPITIDRVQAHDFVWVKSVARSEESSTELASVG